MADGALSRCIDAYLASLAARRYSPATLVTYAMGLQHLRYCVGEVAPATLDPHAIRRALATLRARGMAPRTLARTLSSWRGLFHFLARAGEIAHNPCIGLRPPKAEKRLPNTPSVDDMARLLASGETPGDAQAAVWQARDLAMFELMYSSGLRRAELIGLNLGDVDLDAGEVKVLGKGAKTRVVPVGTRALTALRHWLSLRDRVARDTPALFVGRRGARIAPSPLHLALRRLAVRQGVGAHLHPHALRHAFASHLLQSSGDLRAVQEMLGHASLSTTQVYTHLDFQHLAQVYDQAHPRARKK